MMSQVTGPLTNLGPAIARRASRLGRKAALAAMIGAVLVGSSVASAQLAPRAKEALQPPTISGKSEDGQGWAVTAAVLFLILSIIATIIPSKRGHQD